MIVLVKANVLAVGLNGISESLRELPIRVISMRSGVEAARSLKSQKVDSVISKWDLDGMENGRFLKMLKAARPDVPTIAFVKAGDVEQEIAARSLGVSAVLTDEVSDELFQETVANVLKLKNFVSIKTMAAVKKRPKTKVAK